MMPICNEIVLDLDEYRVECLDEIDADGVCVLLFGFRRRR